MKNNKKHCKRITRDKILESFGGTVERNYWLQVGLSRSELALVKRLAKLYGFKSSPSAAMARQLILMALINQPVIEPSWKSMLDYCKAEGIRASEYVARRARQVLDSLHEDKAYAWKKG